MNKNRITLAKYLTEATQNSPQGGALVTLLLDIANCTKDIAALTARGALAEVNEKLESQNVQGETQMKLDVLTNDLFISTLKKSGLVAGLASEEMDAPYLIADKAGADKFLVIFDPLDGSSNVAVNVSVGSIFSVLNAPQDSLPQDGDYLQAGTAQIAAGYALYGPSTMLVITVGKGTHGFTLDPDTAEFVLTHPAIQIPEMTSEFAINMSNERFWELPVQRYVTECKAGSTDVRGRDFNMRWVASMVADVHRILMRGGIYIYPKDNKLPLRAGRLRLMYEANPMSFIVEQASGKSSTGRARILEIKPEQVHQRVPVMIGSRQEVALLERYHQDFDAGLPNNNYSPLFSNRSLFHNIQ